MTLRAHHLNWAQSEVWLSSLKGFHYFMAFFLPFWVPTDAQPSLFPRSLAPLLVTTASRGSEMAPAAARLGRSAHTACTSRGLQYLLQTKPGGEDRDRESFGSVREKYGVGLNRRDSFEIFLISWARHFVLHDNTFSHCKTEELKVSDSL